MITFILITLALIVGAVIGGFIIYWLIIGAINEAILRGLGW